MNFFTTSVDNIQEQLRKAVLTNMSRFSSQKQLVITALIPIPVLSIAIAFQPIRPVKNSFNPVLQLAQTSTSGNYRSNVSLGDANVSIGGGGYVTGVYLHPRQKDLVYIKTDVGGFYRWNSVNQKWVPLLDNLTLDQSNYYGGEAIALVPTDPNIVYLAVGKYTYDQGTILKSTDQGKTWTKLNIDLPMGGNQNKRWVGERLAVNPLDANIILFGSRRDGLWQSQDAGVTWKKVSTFPGTLIKDLGITAIAFDKQVSGLVYASVYGDGIYVSTDTGTSWNKIAGSPNQAMRLAVASNSTLYVTSATKPGVSKYANGSWTDVTPNNSQTVFDGLSVNPANPNDVLVSLGETSSTKIYHSLDGGATWIDEARSINNTVPWWSSFMQSNPWLADIQFDPQVAGRVWVTDWFGVWRTDDISANPVAWKNYEQGHEELVTFTLVSPPSGPLLLSGVADVDGFYHNNGLDAYPSSTLGPGDPGLLFQDTYSIAYCETVPSNMVRVGGARSQGIYTGATSTDGGLTWKQFASWQWNQIPLRVAMSATNSNLFVVSVSEGQTLYTNDGGASWKTVSGLPNGILGPWNWSLPLAADTVDGNTFYYYSSGKVYRSTDGGSSFQTVNTSLPSVDWFSLKTVPGVKGEVWVSLNSNGLYYSKNGGQTFSQIAGVENAYLFAFGKPQTGSTTPALYVYGNITGLGAGIFRSLDKGKTWTSIGSSQKIIGDEPNVMEASKQYFGLVFVGTNGRGVYYGSP